MGFSQTLKKRVADYFESTNKSKYANASMVLKTIFMLMLLLVPFVIMYTGTVTSVGWFFVLYVISGFGKAGVGMGVMHDAIHGSYSSSKIINKYVGLTINLLGANENMWRLQHNVLHHGYTNIDEKDEDIKVPFFLRLSPHAPQNKLHRFQHLYSWFFYGLSTMSWVTTKDFNSLKRYYKLGLIKDQKAYRRQLFNIISWKVLYFSYALILPALLSGFSFWIVLLGFLSMHFVTGITITFVFQTAHVMPNTDFPLPDEKGQMATDQMVHQLYTTSNFALKSRIFSWFIGGLNYQVEHHLFPRICHVHYRKIAPIIQKTAEEYGLPYLYKKTFVTAVLDHLRMLRNLGRMKVQRISRR